MSKSPWIEAMRLRTLPVSTAGVLAGCAIATAYRQFDILPAAICLVFAIAAQIVSNFANEYYDFKNGLDKKGRQGFRRGVTEGDIKPETMKKAMIWLMIADCALGCTLIYWGGFQLIGVGMLIAIAAFAYSAGPWPLSHHGLGDEMVIIFYGVVPVMLTAFLQCGGWDGGEMAIQYGEMWKMALPVSLGIGIIGANVLTVNNVRDVNDDRTVGKHTKAVIFGATTMKIAYVAFAYIGLFLIWYATLPAQTPWGWIGYIAVGICFVPVIRALFKYSGSELNKVLKQTAQLLLATTVWCIADIIMAQILGKCCIDILP